MVGRASIAAGGGGARAVLAGEGGELFGVHGTVMVRVHVVKAGTDFLMEFVGG